MFRALVLLVAAGSLFLGDVYAEPPPYFKAYSQKINFDRNDYTPRHFRSGNVVAVKDIDADGYDDFVVTQGSSVFPYRIYYGSSDMSFSKFREIEPDVGQRDHSHSDVGQTIFTDVNGDGLPDLVEFLPKYFREGPSTGSDSNYLRVALNTSNWSNCRSQSSPYACFFWEPLIKSNCVPTKLSSGYVTGHEKLQALDFDNDGDIDFSVRENYEYQGKTQSQLHVFQNEGWGRFSPVDCNTLERDDSIKFSGERFFNDADANPEVVFTGKTDSHLSREIPVFTLLKDSTRYTLRNVLSAPLFDRILDSQLARLTSSGYQGLITLAEIKHPDDSRILSEVGYFPYGEAHSDRLLPYRALLTSTDFRITNFVTTHVNNDGLQDLVTLLKGSKQGAQYAGLGIVTNQVESSLKRAEFSTTFAIPGIPTSSSGMTLQPTTLLQGDFNGDGFSDLLIKTEHHAIPETSASFTLGYDMITVMKNHGDWGIGKMGIRLNLIVTNPQYNWSGKYKEKWLQSLSQNTLNGGWYFILPSGKLFRWNKQDGRDLSKSEFISQLHPSFYAVTRKLVYAGQPGGAYDWTSAKDTPPTAEAIISKYSLTTDGRLQQNWFGKGLEERWIFSKVMGNVFVLPDGKMFKYIKGQDPRDPGKSVKFETASPEFYKQVEDLPRL